MITLKDVSVAYPLPGGKRRQILENVSLHVKRGELVYLIGPTGSGKSTFLRLLYMDLFPDKGWVQVGDYRSDRIKTREIPLLRRSLGIVFQDFQLLPDRTVYENVAFALYVTGHKRKDIRPRVIKALTEVGLTHRQKVYPHELSGGEQQRVCIARAIVNEPRILLADEPTGNLDPAVADEIQEVLMRLHRQGMTMVMATHNYRLVHRYPARTLAIMKRTLVDVQPESLMEYL